MNLLITGGDQGLGMEIASQPEWDDVEIVSGPEIMEAIKHNELKDFMSIVVAELKWKPDVVINNFGINHLSWIGETRGRDGLIMEANVMTGYWLVNALAEYEGMDCRILNISSVAGRIPMRCTSLYCASKAAIIHMTKVMGRELAPKGYVVNCFAPGKIMDTEMGIKTDGQVGVLRNWSPETVEQTQLDAIPMGRFMSLHEAARIAISIIELPKYINGTTIEASGGV